MADILVQHAVIEVAKSIGDASDGINYAEIFGQNLNDLIGTIISTNSTGGPFGSSSGTAATNCLCRLSEMCCISHCQCNFSGSGTSSTNACGTNNVWKDGSVLVGGTPAVSTTEIINTLLGLESTGVLNKVYDTNSTQVAKDMYFAYLVFKTTTSDSDILETWYGQGGEAEIAGTRLSNTNYLKVCDSNWKSGQGPAQCTWTVPSGATRVKFQVWGAGHGTNPGCCCGGQSFGTTGHYAELTMDATPGDTYTICAGCSCSRFCCSNAGSGFGCASGVTGPGICCLHADGAACYNSPCEDMQGMRQCFSLSTCRRWQNPYCTTSGPCFCGCGEYCYDNSCATCGVIPVYPSCCTSDQACSCACTDRNPIDGLQQTFRGITGGGCLDTNNYGYHIRPPVIDSDTGLLFDGGCYCQNFTSGTCCGGCNGVNWTAHPGHGGTGTHIMGGTTNHKGDTGKAGMVQISWT